MTATHFPAEWALRSSILILSGALLLWALRVKDLSGDSGAHVGVTEGAVDCHARGDSASRDSNRASRSHTGTGEHQHRTARHSRLQTVRLGECRGDYLRPCGSRALAAPVRGFGDEPAFTARQPCDRRVDK